MKRRSANYLLLLVILPVSILIGLLVVQEGQAQEGNNQLAGNDGSILDPDKISQIFPAVVFAGDATQTPGVTPTPVGTPVLGDSTSGQAPLDSQLVAFDAELFAFVDVPAGPLTTPYVVLFANQSVRGTSTVEIRGSIDLADFVCEQTPCTLQINDGSVIRFWAYAGGETSEPLEILLRVYQQDGGYFINIETTTRQLVLQSDSCATLWGFQSVSSLPWTSFPANPNQLNTQKKLHYLAEQLIVNGLVNASDCPGGGFSLGAPNACGLERAFDLMVEWQNQYDFHFWLSGRDYGIPPKILKTLIEVETQFWPSNERYFFDEIGLGQVNQFGIDVLLRKNPVIYQQVCPTVLSDCSVPYQNLSSSLRAMVRGATLDLLFSADCPSCELGMDLERASQSIPFIAMLLQANCSQVDLLLDQYSTSASYEDRWKFTLASYHSGLGCVDTALAETLDKNYPTSWTNVSNEFTCVGAKEYVDRFWTSLVTFDSYLAPIADISANIVAAVIEAPPTPRPTATPALSRALVQVFVVVDANKNGIPEDDEWAEDVLVQLDMADGTVLTQNTVRGVAQFNLDGYQLNLTGVASLPGLYRSTTFTLPDSGIVPIVFVFTEPLLPEVLP